MSFESLLVHDTYIVTPDESTDDHNNTVYDWGVAATRVAAKAWITQIATDENRADRQTPGATWVAFLRAGSEVGFANRIEWGDLVFEIDGLPRRAWSPSGEHHVEVPLRYSAGAEAAAVTDDYGAY